MDRDLVGSDGRHRIMGKLISAKAFIEALEKHEKNDRTLTDYQRGINDGLQIAKMEAEDAPTVDAIPVEYIEYEKQRLNPVIAVEIKHGDMKEAERLTAIVAVMDAIISNWRYTTGPDWRAARREE